MNNQGLVWVVDDHKLRREGTAGVLQPWAERNAICIRQIDHPGQLPPVSGDVPAAATLCILSLGGHEVASPDGQSAIGAALDALDGRMLVVWADTVAAGDAAQMRALGVRALISTRLPSEIAVAALDLVMAGGSYLPGSRVEAEHPMAAPAMSVPPRSSGGAASAISPHPWTRPVDLARVPVAGSDSGVGRLPMGAILSSGVPLTDLTKRQREVVEALQQGYSNKHIARMLDLSEATIKLHVRQLIRKFGANNRTQVAMLASRQAPAATTQPGDGR